MGWQISKEFSFCYGHRVWSQQLYGEFANDLKCACRHLHGHEGRVEVSLGQKLGTDGFEAPLVRGMVTDFRHTEWLKKFLDSTIDHKFIIDKNDPLLVTMLQAVSVCNTSLLDVELHTYNQDGSLAETLRVGQEVAVVSKGGGNMTGAEIEYMASFFVVDFVPTSENLSQWLFDLVEFKMSRLCRVVSVDWWETAKSHSLYVGG